MRKSMRALGVVGGLAALVGSLRCNVASVGLDLIPAEVNNLQVYNGDLCEEDLLGGAKIPVASWELVDDALDVFQTNSSGVEIENSRDLVRLSVEGVDTDGNGHLDLWTAYVTKGDGDLAYGEDPVTENVQIRAGSNFYLTTNTGFVTPALNSLTWSGNGFDVPVKVHDCNPDPDYPYTVGDGVCEEDLGESSLNSPDDCFVACRADSDCGLAELVGEPYCLEGDMVQDKREYSCEEAGTLESHCVYTDTPVVVEECQLGCNEAGCLSLNDLSYLSINGENRGTGDPTATVYPGLNVANLFYSPHLRSIVGEPGDITYSELGTGVEQPGCFRVETYTQLERNPSLDRDGFEAYTSEFYVVNDLGCTETIDLFQASVDINGFGEKIVDGEIGSTIPLSP